MALNSSGPISLGGATQGQSVNLEIGAGASSTIAFNDTSVRTLTGTTTNTTLIMPTDFYGKALGTTLTYLAIAGGGGGQNAVVSYAGAGGGGAGGYTAGSFTAPTTSTITVTIGTGGAAGAAGGNTSITGCGVTTVTAVGGGYGGSGSGGSGGGALGSATASGGTATSGQGYAGGSTTAGGAGAGGGGAGAVGGNGSGYTGGNGGNGLASSITGSSVTRAGGGGGGGGIIVYNATRSLRFRSSNSAYLNRTPASASNRQTWTWSGWVKRGSLGSYQCLFGAGSSGPLTTIYFNTTDSLVFYTTDSLVSTSEYQTTSAVFRDPASWYHVVVAVDTTQATYANRVKIYVNAVQQAVTVVNQNTQITQNASLGVNRADVHNIARYPYGANEYVDGYLAEVNFIDGQALDPTSFGYFSGTTGVWQPIAYTGTYGTNGFYLPFTDNSALTTSSNVGLGKDFSGNGNYWTTNNISITAGVSYDSMTDVPTLTSAAASNYAVMNPLFKSTRLSGLSDSNLKITGISGGNFYGGYTATMYLSSGKIYWEVTAINLATTNSYFAGGIATNNYLSTESNGSIAVCPGGTTAGSGTGMNFYPGNTGSELSLNGSTSALSASYAAGDVMNFALDASTGKFWIGKNGTWLSSGNPAAGTNQIGTITGGTSYAPWFGAYTTSDIWAINLGQQPFTYTPPSGFVALNTYNLPTPTVIKGNTVMDATLYTGNGTTLTVTNAAAFKPNFVWLKSRSNAYSHALYDSVRGVYNSLFSNATNAETTEVNTLTAFNTNGFSIGSETRTNASAATYVGWQWQAGVDTTATNTSGSITSTTSVNTTAGFSVVTWTYNSSGGTIGHGLGAAPQFIIQKDRTNGTYNWDVYHVSLGATQRLSINTTAAAQTYSGPWNNTTPTSTVFSSGASWYTNGDAMVSYCWTAIPGFSSFGSYVGNGSTDGPFVYTGFRPKYVMAKGTATSSWYVWDSVRSTYNVINETLYPNLANAEGGSGGIIDFLSNGFKIRTTGTDLNTNGNTMIYMAFAENPFKYALAR